MTARFRIFDLTLESDVALPELDASGGRAAEIVLRRGEPAHRPVSPAWFRTVRIAPDETPWLTVGRSGRGLVLEFRDRLTLAYDPPVVRWWRGPALDDGGFRHLLLNQALPMIAAQTGRTVLHAACVSRHGRALAIAGPAGAGKSTLAAALGSRGWGVEGDDAVAFTEGRTGIVAHPAYPGVRLWPDARAALGLTSDAPIQDDTEKRQIRIPGVAAATFPAAGICILDPAPEVGRLSVRRLSGRDAVMSLIRNAFVLDTADHARAAVHLGALARLASATPVFELSVSRDFTLFDPIAHLLTDCVAPVPVACR